MKSKIESLRDVLVIEDTADILDFKCEKTSISLWILIRNYFLREVISDILYKNSIVGTSHIGSSSSKALGSMARYTFHNLTKPVKAPEGVCIMPSGMGLRKQDGVWFNKLSDHFALAAPEVTCVIEDRFDWNWPFPRRFSNVMFHAPYQAAGVIWGRLKTSNNAYVQAERIVELAEGRANEYFGWRLKPARRSHLVRMFAGKIAALPFMFSMYQRLLASTQAKLLLKEEACYGTSAVVVAAARSLGMITAEYQHGLISSGHDAYNFAPTVRESSALKNCLPEYFLGYGDWWFDNMNAPVNKIAVGNPHRTSLIETMQPRSEKSWLLVIGDGIDTEMFLEFAASLVAPARQLGLQVVFRPHPMERHLFEAGANPRGGIQIDSHGEIYHSLACARAVIGEASTALFEASGVADAVFVWRTPKSRFNLPSHPFVAVSTAEQMMRELENQAHAVSGPQSGLIWAHEWRRNYLAFLKKFGISPSECA